MYDPKFQLIPENQQQQKVASAPRSKQRFQRFTIGAILTLMLALSAIYSPLFWGNEPVAAKPVAELTTARTLQLDASLFGDQEALANLYERVAPSVVSIQVETNIETPFGFPGQGGGQGSGFIYDHEGHIVTNNHVVDDADGITVLFHNGFWAEAEVIATDPQADLAVIKVTPPDNFAWQPLPLASPEKLRVGHMVIAMGNPFGLDSTMTTGIVSALGRGMPVGDGPNNYTLPDVIQTDAAINPGNSGGPLINLHGEVVGVNFAIRSDVRSNSGVGFTIPVSIVRRVVPALIEEGGFRYPFLGLSGQTIGPRNAEELGLTNNQTGVYVASVVPDGPSDFAGLVGGGSTARGRTSRGGDIIIAIDGEPVHSFEDMVGYLVTETSPDQTVTLTVLRDGREMAINVTLGDRPGSPRLTRGGSEPRRINAREAISIAVEAVTDGNHIDGEILQKVATPDEIGGIEVWVVELSTNTQVATVTVAQADGTVMEIVVE